MKEDRLQSFCRFCFGVDDEFPFIVEGVISYSASSLGEDAVKGAGESIMANYDRELFKNYHLFFLDPRQKDYIVTDGKEFINQ